MNDQAIPTEINDRNFAATTQNMLRGIQLTGADVPTFVAIHNWLDAIATGQLVLVTPAQTAPAAGMTLPKEVDVAPYDPANPEHPAPTQHAPGDV